MVTQGMTRPINSESELNFGIPFKNRSDCEDGHVLESYPLR